MRRCPRGTDTFKMATRTRVPCDGQINRIRTERKQYRKQKCFNTWTEPLWAGRFLHVTFHLEPGESSSGLKGQSKVSCFNSSATWNEESLLCRQKAREYFCRQTSTSHFAGVWYRSSRSNLCKAIQYKAVLVYNAAGCVKRDTEKVDKCWYCPMNATKGFSHIIYCSRKVLRCIWTVNDFERY